MATLAEPRIEFTRVPHPAPVPGATRAEALADPGFGKVFSDHMVSLTWSDWQLLSPLPLLAFLALIKFAYFSAFTALGGQTIGKMAMHIRVVSEQNRLVDPAHAVRRSLAGALSLLTLGIGFLPALVTTERRALHDRLAHTRVVTA